MSIAVAAQLKSVLALTAVLSSRRQLSSVDLRTDVELAAGAAVL
jgi:hypothetical protein